MSTEYGKLLRVSRKKAGLSLAEVARMMKISAAYLSDIERGRRAPLYYDATVELAGHLGIDPDQLLIAMVRQSGIRTSMDNASDERLRLLVAVFGSLNSLTDEQAARFIELIERVTEGG